MGSRASTRSSSISRRRGTRRTALGRCGDTRQAVVEDVGRTGRLVSSAALILFISFAALAMTPELDVKVFASGLALPATP